MPKVLMVEDDFDFAEIMSECLQSDPDCEILEVITNLADAEVKFEWGGLKGIDAVLVDLQIPTSRADGRIIPDGGLQLIKQMRHRHGFRGRVIVLTNSGQLSDGQKALDAGCDGYLCKHVRSGDLPMLIAELRMAIRGDVVLVSQEMRHVFMREQPEYSQFHRSV
jgi:DNA-binding NarL/FixJ family response regulator